MNRSSRIIPVCCGLLAGAPGVLRASELPSLDDSSPLGGAKGAAVETPAAREGAWTFSAGPVWRQVGEVRFFTGQTRTAIPPVLGSDSFTEPAGIGPIDGYADRSYDDGFVSVGAATSGTGLTTNWGYDSAGQLQGGNLVYSRSGGERRELLDSGSVGGLTGWREDASTEVGPYLELNYSLPAGDGLTVGAGVNFSFVNIGAGRAGLTTFEQGQTLNVYDVTAIDRYGLNGIVPPQAPYSGSYAGPGALINNVPDSRSYTETLNSRQTAAFRDSIAEDLDLDFYTIGLGGQVAWWPCEGGFLRGEGGLAVNIASWNASRGERVMQSSNGGASTRYSHRVINSSDNDVLLGLYLQGAAGWQISEDWSVQAFGRYDWNESLDGAVGGSRFSVDLNGWSAGLAAGFRF